MFTRHQSPRPRHWTLKTFIFLKVRDLTRPRHWTAETDTFKKPLDSEILATKTTSLELNQTNKSIKTNFYSAIHRERIRADVSCVDEVFYFAIALLFHKTPTVSRRLLISTVLTSCEALCLKIETRPRPSPLETEMKLKCWTLKTETLKKTSPTDWVYILCNFWHY